MKQHFFKVGIGVFLVAFCASAVPTHHAEALYLNPLLRTTTPTTRVTNDTTATTTARVTTPVSPLKLKKHVLKNGLRITKPHKFKPVVFPKLKKTHFKSLKKSIQVSLPPMHGKISTSSKNIASSTSATYKPSFTKKSTITPAYKKIVEAVFGAYTKQIDEKKKVIEDLEKIVAALEAKGTATNNLADVLAKAKALVAAAETNLQNAKTTFATLEGVSSIAEAQKLTTDIKQSLKSAEGYLNVSNDVLIKAIALVKSLGATYQEQKKEDADVVYL
jgi:ribosome-binding protein aMBF1 (putative translation factor)